jgi:hypothetical protein
MHSELIVGQCYVAAVRHVVDGATFDADIVLWNRPGMRSWLPVRVRVDGIVVPERDALDPDGRAVGQQARLYLAYLLSGGRVQITPVPSHDEDGDLRASVVVESLDDGSRIDVAAALRRAGHATIKDGADGAIDTAGQFAAGGDGWIGRSGGS